MERIQVLMPASFEEGEAIGNVLFAAYGLSCGHA